MAGGSQSVVIKALAANLGIAIAKFVAAFLSGSASMLSEAVHSLADSGNQFFLMLGMRRATRREDAIHEFGYAGERYFWAFIVAVSLFTMGATFSLYEGIHKVLHPGGEQGSATVAYVVLGVSIALEMFSLSAALAEFRHIKAGRSLKQTIDEARDAVVIVVLFEDVAALIGLVAAFGGLLLTHVTGNGVWDGVGSIIVGVTLFGVAYFLAQKTKRLLIGQSVTPAQRARMIELVEASPGVRQLIHLRTMHLGPEEVLVGMKVVVGDDVNTRDATQFIDLIEARLRAELPILKRIYIELGAPEDPRVRMTAPTAAVAGDGTADGI
ncbi:MAG: cation diffusion facilitator family transporter [Deltaproteobacteria bacterium]|nr:cation diffusion facilitator family transporter [Deltaproteobacteria bacterium]